MFRPQAVPQRGFRSKIIHPFAVRAGLLIHITHLSRRSPRPYQMRARYFRCYDGLVIRRLHPIDSCVDVVADDILTVTYDHNDKTLFDLLEYRVWIVQAV